MQNPTSDASATTRTERGLGADDRRGSGSVAHAAPHPFRFHHGGPVVDDDGYVERQAEQEVLATLSVGEYCHVVGPLESGKTSLALHAMGRLRALGISCAIVELSAIGRTPSIEALYASMCEQVAAQLGLAGASLSRDPSIAPALRLKHFLHDEVLRRNTGGVVLFIDDVDVLETMDGAAAEFAALVQRLYDERGVHPENRRLTLCLLGGPGALALHPSPERPSLAMCRVISLADFSERETEVLLSGLRHLPGPATAWLSCVLSHTGGHPALTLRLCQALARRDDLPAQPDAQEIEALVGDLVDKIFLGPAAAEDPLLLHIRRRLGKDQPAGNALAVYRRVLEHQRVPALPLDPDRLLLLRLGLVSERSDEHGTYLAPRCRVLSRAFDLAWIRREEDGRFLGPRVAAWREHERDMELTLSGQELTEALRWAKDRVDVTPEEREFLLASEEAVLVRERRQREEEQVRDGLQKAREERMRRRRSAVVLSLLGATIVSLLGVILWLTLSGRAAREREHEARRESARLLGTLTRMERALSDERRTHGETRARLATSDEGLARAEKDLKTLKEDLARRQARLKEVDGRVETLLKKRTAAMRGDTGINNKSVGALMLGRAWPRVRACYPAAGRLPQRLRVAFTVTPDGKLSEIETDAQGEQRACVLAVMHGLRFPSYRGALMVRVSYHYLFPRDR